MTARYLAVAALMLSILTMGLFEMMLEEYRLHAAAEWLARICLLALLGVSVYVATAIAAHAGASHAGL